MYTLRVPFSFESGSGLHIPKDNAFAVHSLSGRLLEEGPYYALYLEGYRTDGEARAFLAHVEAAFSHILVTQGLATTEVGALQDPYYHPVPKDNEDGAFDQNFPTVYMTAKNMRRGHGPAGATYSALPPEWFVEGFCRGLDDMRVTTYLSDERLRTAISLLRLSSHERSQNAEFLALIMGLEVLVAQQERSPATKRLVEDWLNQITKS